MFDIGFPELLIVSVVALLVIGPEKLPETIRSLSLWIGRFRRSLSNLRMEIENEIGADEIRQQLHNESIMQSLKETKTEIDVAIRETENTLRDMTHPLHHQDVGPAVAPPVENEAPTRKVSTAPVSELKPVVANTPGEDLRQSAADESKPH